MTAVLVVTILAAVLYVGNEIAGITAECCRVALDDERADTLADQPTTEGVGQPAKGMER